MLDLLSIIWNQHSSTLSTSFGSENMAVHSQGGAFKQTPIAIPKYTFEIVFDSSLHCIAEAWFTGTGSGKSGAFAYKLLREIDRISIVTQSAPYC